MCSGSGELTRDQERHRHRNGQVEGCQPASAFAVAPRRPQAHGRCHGVQHHRRDVRAQIDRHSDRHRGEHEVVRGEHRSEADNQIAGNRNDHDTTSAGSASPASGSPVSVALVPASAVSETLLTGSGHWILMSVPWPSADSISTTPPALATRSRIDTRSPSRSVGTVRVSKPDPGVANLHLDAAKLLAADSEPPRHFRPRPRMLETVHHRLHGGGVDGLGDVNRNGAPARCPSFAFRTAQTATQSRP